VHEVIERYAPRFAVLSGVSLLIVLMAWLGMGLRMLERRQHPNALSTCTEAYLSTCQYQLVNWREWRAETFSEAQKTDRLVFVEVGAFWSGRAKRLGRELFQDSGVADLLNREFIPVKVDADSAPKRARYLRQVAQLLNTPLRYPLIVIFTPDGEPLAALAPETRSELMRLLEATSKSYRTNPEETHRQADALTRLWEQRWFRPATPIEVDSLAEPSLPELPKTAEDWIGGQPDLLNELEWLLAQSHSDLEARSLLVAFLHHLRQSVLWDPKSGGFYALAEGVDYELKPIGGKLLTEHARLLRLYALASRHDRTLAPIAHEIAQAMRTIFWNERPAGFYHSTRPPLTVRALSDAPQGLHTDRTVVAESNALAVLALVDYWRVFGHASSHGNWAFKSAQRTLETLRAMQTPEGHLYHTSRRQTAEWLRDLSLTLLAGCAVETLQPDPSRRRWLAQLSRMLVFYMDPTGGYYDTPRSKQWGGWSLTPVRMSVDDALPADNVLVAQALLAYSRTSGDPALLEQAMQTLRVVAGDHDPQQGGQSFSFFALRHAIRHATTTTGTH